MISEDNIVGTIVSDEVSPSFDVFRFKAKHDKYVTPGSLIATAVSPDIFLVGRITGSHEHNPYEMADKVAVEAQPIRPLEKRHQ